MNVDSSIFSKIGAWTLVELAVRELEKKDKACGGRSGLLGGLPSLDRIVADDFAPGSLWAIKGTMQAGKTSLAFQLLEEITREPRVLALTTDHRPVDLLARIMANRSRIPVERFQNGRLQDADWPRLIKAAGRLAYMPFCFSPIQEVSLQSIRSALMGVDEKIEILVIDKVDPFLLWQSEDRGIHRFVVGLKKMMREMSCAVVITYDLPDAEMLGVGKMDGLVPLRELELAVNSYAEVILEVGRLNGDDRGNISVRKNRYGATGSVPVLFSSGRIEESSEGKLLP